MYSYKFRADFNKNLKVKKNNNKTFAYFNLKIFK